MADADFLVVGVGDFDADGEAFVVGPTLLPGATPPPMLPAGDAVGDELALWLGDAEWLWAEAVELVPGVADGELLLEISTAMMAMMPTAATPIPANKKVRDPLPRGAGIRCASF